MANRKNKNTPSGQAGQGSQNSSPLNKRAATNIAKRKLSDTSHLANDSPSKRTRSQILSRATKSPVPAATTRTDSTIQPPSSAASSKNGKNTDAGKKGQSRNAMSTASRREKLSRGSPKCSPLSVKKEVLKSGSTRGEKQGSEFKDKVEPEPKPEPVRDWNDCSDVSEIGSNCPCDRCRGLLDTTDESDADNDDTTTDDDDTDDDDGDTVKVKSPSPSDEILRRLPRYQNQNQNQNRQLPRAGARNWLQRQATARIEPPMAITHLTDSVVHKVSADITKAIDLRILELQAEIETAQMKSEYEAKRAEVLKGYLDNLRDRRILGWD